MANTTNKLLANQPKTTSAPNPNATYSTSMGLDSQPTQVNATATATSQPADRDSLIQQYKQQIMGAKLGVSDPNLTQAQKNAYYKQSNEARSALQNLGFDTESTFLKSGLSYQDSMMGYMGEQFKAQSDAQYAQQQAMLSQAHDTAVAGLKKALEDAVAQGKISEREAQNQFESQKAQLDTQYYQDAEATKLYSSEHGIQDSNQAIGLQQGDNARHTNNVQTAMTSRDSRLADIRDRLNAIKNQTNLDIANADSSYQYQLAGARAQADSQYNANMSNLLQGTFSANLNHMFDQQNAYQQQQYTQSNMNLDNKFKLGQMAQQQKYTQDNMKLQQQFDLTKMKTQHGYDLEKMSKQQSYDLTKMAKQYGYDMSKISAEQRNAISRINAQSSAQMKAQNASYLQQRARVEASYTKGTPEYNIRMSQINEANDQAMRQYANKALFESLTKVVKPGTPAYNKLLSDPLYGINNYAEMTRTGGTGYTELHAK